MPTPLDGLKIKVPETSYRGDDFKNLNFAQVSIGPDNYIYYQGDILGPVEKAIGPVEVSGGRWADNPPKIVMFGEGDQFGVFVNGKMSDLFDEFGKFSNWDDHLWYTARRGDQWCYVLDGVIHGWYDRIDKNGWVGFEGKKFIFYAEKGGEAGYWLNDQPLALYATNLYSVSGWQWEGKEIAFIVTKRGDWRYKQSSQGVWCHDKVDRWFDTIEKINVTDGGLRYIGVDSSGRYFFYRGEYHGPYDKVEWWYSSYLKLERGTLVAVFTKDRKQFVRIGDWVSKLHGEIKEPVEKDGHRLVIAVDAKRGKNVYTYYVDEKFCCQDESGKGYIKDGKLCFTKPSVLTVDF